MSAPTPGPWTFDEHGGAFYVWGPGMAMVADGDPKDYVTRIRGVGRGASTEEQRANARLIAAAPDLLAAAKLALRYLEHPDVQVIPLARSAVSAAQVVAAAIDKAEGRS